MDVFIMNQDNLSSDEKEEFTPSWGNFLFFLGFFLFIIFLGEGWVVPFGGIMFGICTLLSWPSKNGNKWIKEQFSNLGHLSWNMLKICFYVLIIIGGIWFVGKIFGGITGLGKYEGLSAEEWYYEYTYVDDKYEKLYDCVEDYVYEEDYSALESIQYYCL